MTELNMPAPDGFVDGLQANSITGWASYGPDDPRPPQLTLLIDGHVVARCEGTISRPGVKQRGLHPTGLCGFSFSLDIVPDALRKDPRVFSVHLATGETSSVELRNCPKGVVWDTEFELPTVKKLFFMHIAKAAGTSVNHMMEGFYSPLSCVTHVETQFQKWPAGHAKTFDFVSGHIEAPVARKLGINDSVWVTLFRRPRPHLFSHINWLRHIGSDPQSDFHLTHSQAVRDLSLKLAEVRPGDEKALAAVLDYENPTVRTLFDNRQTRYLLPRNTHHVTETLVEQALANLDWFDLIGTLENIEVFNKQLPRLLGTNETVELPKLNQQPDIAPLNYQDFSVELALPFIRFDREIYWAAQDAVRHRAGLNNTGKRHATARQPKPKCFLRPRLTSVENAKHPGRQPCMDVVESNGDSEKTIVVLGVSRGGTSMISGLLQLMGVFMGENLSANSHEDVEFHNPDPAALRRLVAKRNAEHTLWGWKYPHTLDYLSKIRRQLRNPHFILVYRDVSSVAQAFHRHDGVGIKSALRDAQSRYDALTRFALRCEQPLLTISYEKAIGDPNSLIRGMSRFCGLELSMQEIAHCIQFITPGRYAPLRAT